MIGFTIIQAEVKDQRLRLKKGPMVASGGVNEDLVVFAFDAAWDGFAKVAVFYRNRDEVYHVEIQEDRAIVPKEVLAAPGCFYIGVMGVKDGTTRTTNVLSYWLAEGAMTEGTAPPEPTPSIYEQILASVQEAQRIAQSVQDDADEGRFDGKTPERGVDYWTEADKQEVVREAAAAVNAPVKSVNGQTGEVVLTAEDVGALPADTLIPSVPVQDVRVNNASVLNTANEIANINRVPEAECVIPRSTSNALDFSTLPFSPFSGGDPFAFLPPDRVIIEKTTDGGNTWEDAGVSDVNKRLLFTPGNQTAVVLFPKIDNMTTTGCGIRITIAAATFNVPAGTPETEKINYWKRQNLNTSHTPIYAALSGLFLWASSASASITASGKLAEDSDANFENIFQNVSINGWPGANFIGLRQLFGGALHQIQVGTSKSLLRLEFYPKQSVADTLSISNISGVAASVWRHQNNFAKNRSIFSWDSGQNVTFPANLVVNGTITAKEKEAVLIERIVIGEEVETLERTVEPDGTRYNFSNVTIRATFPTCDKTGNTALYFHIGNYNLRSYMLNPYNANNVKYGYSRAYLSNRKWRTGWWTCVENVGQHAQYYENPVIQDRYGEDDGYIDNVSLVHYGGIAVGSIIEIYGVRA